MKTAALYSRLAWGLTGVTVLFLVWAVGALGIIGEGGRPDLMYVGVLAVLVGGAAVARLQPAGMARALVATAAAQALVAVIALVAGLQDTAGASVLEILGLTGMYAALWLLAAWFFQQAADQRGAVPVGGRV
jgi:hypothetical protein